MARLPKASRRRRPVVGGVFKEARSRDRARNILDTGTRIDGRD
jgi:hypothetical protein